MLPGQIALSSSPEVAYASRACPRPNRRCLLSLPHFRSVSGKWIGGSARYYSNLHSRGFPFCRPAAALALIGFPPAGIFCGVTSLLGGAGVLGTWKRRKQALEERVIEEMIRDSKRRSRRVASVPGEIAPQSRAEPAGCRPQSSSSA